MAIQQTLDLMDGFKGMDDGFSRGDLTGFFKGLENSVQDFNGFDTGA